VRAEWASLRVRRTCKGAGKPFRGGLRATFESGGIVMSGLEASRAPYLKQSEAGRQLRLALIRVCSGSDLKAQRSVMRSNERNGEGR
jgi:hypothetical protein